jgi:hypothetical protein
MDIKKVKLKNDCLEVSFEELVETDNGTQTVEVTQKCDWLVHNDLLQKLHALEDHLKRLCELYDLSNGFDITGFSCGGSEESAGVTLIGTMKLSNERKLNLVTPFTQFAGMKDYLYADNLRECIYEAMEETELYLKGKSAFKQLEMDFESEVNIAEPKKRGRKKKTAIDMLKEEYALEEMNAETEAEPEAEWESRAVNATNDCVMNIERQYKDSRELDDIEQRYQEEMAMIEL